MAGDVDICNLALGHLGEDATLSSIDPPEGSAHAEHCATFYPIARDSVVSLVEPAWATKRVNLALITPDEQPDIWTYAYTYPGSVIRVLSVGLPEATMISAERQNWISEALTNGSPVIYTNAPLATARVLARITDTTKFGPLMVEAIARKLAAFLAGPIIKGVEGMKVSAAHTESFEKLELPRARWEIKQQERSDAYMNHTPSNIAARS